MLKKYLDKTTKITPIVFLILLGLKLLGVKIPIYFILITSVVFLISSLTLISLKKSKSFFDFLSIAFILVIFVQYFFIKFDLPLKGIVSSIAIAIGGLWFITFFLKILKIEGEGNKLRNYLFFAAAVIIIIGAPLKAMDVSFGSELFWGGIILGLTSIVIEFYHWIKN